MIFFFIFWIRKEKNSGKSKSNNTKERERERNEKTEIVAEERSSSTGAGTALRSEMVTISLLASSHGSFFPSSPSTQLIPLRSATPLYGLRRLQDPVELPNRTKGRAFRLLANPNVSSGKGNPLDEVIMVDPLEAKRLAAKQMQQIRAKENFKRKRQIEAINGAWAMIGLTAGLVIEGQTGKGILGQLVGYWIAIVGFFLR